MNSSGEGSQKQLTITTSGAKPPIKPIRQLVNGQVVGTLGVIGPTRMPYERMIQIVDITSRLVSNALSHQNK